MKLYPRISTIRYMGNKARLLDSIIPKIEKLTQKGEVVCDIMAGTNSIGYALKNRNRIYANDIQYYSYVIGICLLGNYTIPSLEESHQELDSFYLENLKNKNYNFFLKNYVDTYFSETQCAEIDSLRFAIEKVHDFQRKCFYLTALMNAMCKAQSTPGHFAQFMNKDHKRVIPLRKMKIYDLFFEKVSDFKNINTSSYQNTVFNMDYEDLFKTKYMNDVSCFYLDSPYTLDQYSRFYHILETVCKYDEPTLESNKARYRNDRIQSKFCYKKTVALEFEKIFKFCSGLRKPLVVSYSNHGVLSVDELVTVAKKYYKKVQIDSLSYDHSSQGKGVIKINEIILVLEV